MKKVFFTGYKETEFNGYYLDSIDPYGYFPKQTSLQYFYSMAFRKFDGANAFGYAEGIDYLYRTKNKFYMKFINDFIDKYSDYSLLIFTTNYIHPEILYKYFKNSTKILAYIDDPVSTYTRGVPFSWAFDGVFYISPSYEDKLMKNELTKWGIKNKYWYPLCTQSNNIDDKIDDNFFKNRELDIVYVGGWYGKKVDRLAMLKKRFKDKFNIYGRTPLAGYAGYFRPLKGDKIFPYKINSLSNDERKNVYVNTKIGFNMHLTGEFKECGNMRTYEVPYHGMMQISNKAGANAHNLIYKDGIEAVYYDNIPDAIEKIHHYLKNDEERIKIAKAGYERTMSEYNFENNLLKLLKWAEGLKSEK